MGLSDRGRPLCRDEHCDVEITSTEKFCAAHSWHMNEWLKKSRKILMTAKAKEEQFKIAA
jgi:hypothetical protein